MNGSNTLFTTNGVTDSDRALHTPGDFAKRNLLYVQEVGKLKSLKPHKSQREHLDSFLFLGVLSGEGSLTVGEETYKIKKGNCVLINCMDYYAHESSEERPWELMWVHFNGISAKAYFTMFMEQNDNKNIFKPSSFREIQGNINRLMEYQKEKDLESELQSGALLTQILNSCILSVMHRDKDNKEEYGRICNEVREYVNRHYQDSALLGALADKYEMTAEGIDSCFQRTYGITLRDYILNRRFTAAKELLRFTVKPINEIIQESGIQNDDLFRKLFLDGEGMSAEEYRNKWAQWVK